MKACPNRSDFMTKIGGEDSPDLKKWLTALENQVQIIKLSLEKHKLSV